MVTTILFIERAISRATKRSGEVQALVEGHTHPPVSRGLLDLKFPERSTLPHQEIPMRLRRHGARHLEQIASAYLEPDGGFSVFIYENG